MEAAHAESSQDVKGSANGGEALGSSPRLERLTQDKGTLETGEEIPLGADRTTGDKLQTEDGASSAGKEPLEVGKGRKYDIPDDLVEEKSVAGRKTMKVDSSGKVVEKPLEGDSKDTMKVKEEKLGPPRDSGAEAELNVILKKSPGRFCFLIFQLRYSLSG